MDRLRESVVSICFSLGFRLLAYAVAFSQDLSSTCYAYLSRVCGLPPCGIFRVQDSAIVIVGGESELGQTIALSFSELGYTVFTLHPTQQQESHAEPSQQAADTSSATLLYAWHKKKERSGHAWGLVAPIALDISSAADRKRASETIKAYCTTHALQLVALISLSPSPPTSPNVSESARGTGSAHVSPPKHLKRRSAKDFSEALVWGDVVAQSVREPIVIFQDYIDMLARVSGRVIMVSTCSDRLSSPLLPLSCAFDDVQRSIAQYLGRQLASYGIKLCTISTGPLHKHSGPSDPHSFTTSRIGRLSLFQSFDLVLRNISQILRSPADTRIADSLRSFAVGQDDISHLLHDIVVAEYPKDTYCLGLQPYLSRVSQVIPTPIQLLTNNVLAKLSE